jgi:hypothetical protein
VAILACAGFVTREPLEQQTWRMHLDARGVRAICSSPALRLEFERTGFARDPRIAALRWER